MMVKQVIDILQKEGVFQKKTLSKWREYEKHKTGNAGRGRVKRNNF